MLIAKQNGGDISGTLTAPHIPIVSWVEFDFNQDYEFSWTMEESTDDQFISFFLVFENDLFDQYWLIDGSERTFTIEKNIYEDYSAYEPNVYILLSPLNYDINDEILVCSSTSDYYELENEGWPEIKMLPDTDDIKKLLLKNKN